MSNDPIHQFHINPISQPIHLGTIDATFTNASLFMVAGVAIASGFMAWSMRPAALVPGRAQSVTEIGYGFVHSMVKDASGEEGVKRFFPFVMTLFLFIFTAEHFPGPVPHTLAERKLALRRVFGEAGWESARILDAVDGVQIVYNTVVGATGLHTWRRTPHDQQNNVIITGNNNVSLWNNILPSINLDPGDPHPMLESNNLIGQPSWVDQVDYAPGPGPAIDQAIVNSDTPLVDRRADRRSLGPATGGAIARCGAADGPPQDRDPAAP